MVWMFKVLQEKLGTVYNPNDWRHSIDFYKIKSESFCLHNRNQFGSIPVTCIKKYYKNSNFFLSKLQNSPHTLKICVDFKVLNMLLGQ